jgi:hypothetical protein
VNWYADLLPDSPTLLSEADVLRSRSAIERSLALPRLPNVQLSRNSIAGCRNTPHAVGTSPKRLPTPFPRIFRILFAYVFLGGELLATPFLIMMMVLGVLNTPLVEQGRANRSSRYGPSLPVGLAAG